MILVTTLIWKVFWCPALGFRLKNYNNPWMDCFWGVDDLLLVSPAGATKAVIHIKVWFMNLSELLVGEVSPSSFSAVCRYQCTWCLPANHQRHDYWADLRGSNNPTAAQLKWRFYVRARVCWDCNWVGCLLKITHLPALNSLSECCWQWPRSILTPLWACSICESLFFIFIWLKKEAYEVNVWTWQWIHFLFFLNSLFFETTGYHTVMTGTLCGLHTTLSAFNVNQTFVWQCLGFRTSAEDLWNLLIQPAGLDSSRLFTGISCCHPQSGWTGAVLTDMAVQT